MERVSMLPEKPASRRLSAFACERSNRLSASQSIRVNKVSGLEPNHPETLQAQHANLFDFLCTELAVQFLNAFQQPKLRKLHFAGYPLGPPAENCIVPNMHEVRPDPRLRLVRERLNART